MEIFQDSWTYYLSGTIMMFMLGIAAGNYVTSIIYRLPKGLVIANDPPYCECDKRMYLTKRDLFPFFSWFLNKGQCRFCDIKIPVVYTIVEFLCGFLFVTNWMLYGISEQLVMVLCIDAIFIAVVAIYYNENRLFASLLFVLGGLGGIYRTLLDDTIYGFIGGAYMGLMLGIGIWGLEMLLRRKKFAFPDYAVILSMGGLCVGQNQLIPYFIIAFIIASIVLGLGWTSERFKQSAWAFGVAISVMILLSYPQ